jgi:hypothetical protein
MRGIRRVIEKEDRTWKIFAIGAYENLTVFAYT